MLSWISAINRVPPENETVVVRDIQGIVCFGSWSREHGWTVLYEYGYEKKAHPREFDEVEWWASLYDEKEAYIAHKKSCGPALEKHFFG